MNCKNCNTSLLPEASYCSSCGAKVIRNTLTLKNLFADFCQQFLNYDNKFLQTFIALFRYPEEVIDTYIHGTRKKYVNVLSYFTIAITISGIQLYILNKFFPEAMDLTTIKTAQSEKFSNAGLDFLKEYQSIIMMLYVPLYALLAQLVFLKIKRFNYTEHLVIFMYILAQMSVVGTVLTIGTASFGITLGKSSLFIMPLQIVYSAYCLKRLYKLSLTGIILRTLLFLGILLLLFIVFTIIFTIGLILYNGGWEEFAKKQQEVSYIASSVMNWTS